MNKIKDEKGDIITAIIEMQRIIRDYMKQYILTNWET
jgi:hypothetical protein